MPREKESLPGQPRTLDGQVPRQGNPLIHRGFAVHRNGLPSADGQRYPA